MKLSKILCILLLSSFVIQGVQARIIHVPADSSSIQKGINGAVNGDTVSVAPGTYYERINVYGRAIVLIGDTLDFSTTIIDGSSTSKISNASDTASVVCFLNGEQPATTIQGFTIQDGTGTLDDSLGSIGGGIYCHASSPTIRKCNITNNSAEFGGGIAIIGEGSFPTFSACYINGNSAYNGGGVAGYVAAYVYAEPQFISCHIFDNSASEGGAMWCGRYLAPKITGSVIENNDDGICCKDLSYLVIENSILRNSPIVGPDDEPWWRGHTVDIVGSRLESSGVTGYAFDLKLFDDTLIHSDVIMPAGYLPVKRCRLDTVSIWYGSSAHGAGEGYFDSTLIIGSIALNGNGVLDMDHCTLIGDSPIEVWGYMGTVGVHNSAIVTNGGPAISCYDSYEPPSLYLSCCDVFGYSGPDWITGTTEVTDTTDIFHEDPLFCWRANGDYSLQDGSPCLPANNSCGVLLGALGAGCDAFMTGDANGDKGLTIADVVYLVNYLFKSGPVPVPVVQAGDANCNGKVTVSDAIYLINYLFKDGPPPCEP